MEEKNNFYLKLYCSPSYGTNTVLMWSMSSGWSYNEYFSQEKREGVSLWSPPPPLSQNYGHLGRCKKVGSKVIISMNCNNFPHHNFFQIGTFNHQKYKKQNNCDPPLKPLCVQGFYYQLVLTKAFYNLLDQQALSFFRPAKRLISIIFPYYLLVRNSWGRGLYGCSSRSSLDCSTPGAFCLSCLVWPDNIITLLTYFKIKNTKGQRLYQNVVSVIIFYPFRTQRLLFNGYLTCSQNSQNNIIYTIFYF